MAHTTTTVKEVVEHWARLASANGYGYAGLPFRDCDWVLGCREREGCGEETA